MPSEQEAYPGQHEHYRQCMAAIRKSVDEQTWAALVNAAKDNLARRYCTEDPFGTPPRHPSWLARNWRHIVPVGWWKFWNPASGLVGGLIGSTLFWIVVYIIGGWLSWTL